MNEQRKYEVIKKLVETNGNKQRAAIALQLSKRQINRLIKGYKEEGKAFFMHGNRGSKPANTIPDKTRKLIVDLYRTKYFEANFTHYTELLERFENIKLSVSAVFAILEEEYILSPRVTKAKQKRIKKELLQKKDCAKTQKESAQIQANLVAVDDASGMITGAWFDSEETLNGYYHVFHQILTQYGIPYKIFTDCRTIFTYKQKRSPSTDEDTYTQFAYACKQLGVNLESSSVPQAKGRVERMFQTLQSRLPVEMRLAGVTNIKTANEFLNSHIKEFNANFALPLHGIKSVFEVQPTEEKINLTLAIVTERTVDNGHCIQFRKKIYRMLDKNGNQVHYQKGTKTMVIQAYDGQQFCCVNDKEIYSLKEIPKHESKSEEFDWDYEKPEKKEQYIPPMSHPWKRQSFEKFLKKQKHHMEVKEKTA